jgi:hypothetical protein
MDKVVGFRIRPDFPVPGHTALHHSDSHFYPGLDMFPHTGGNEQALELEMTARRSDYRVKTSPIGHVPSTGAVLLELPLPWYPGGGCGRRA